MFVERHLPPAPATREADLAQKLAEVERRLRVLEGSFNPLWQEETLLHSWKNVAGRPIGFLVDPLGFVHMKGQVESGENEKAILILPKNFRPKERHGFAVQTGGGGGQIGAVIVEPNGEVVPILSSGVAPHLSTVSFLAEQ